MNVIYKGDQFEDKTLSETNKTLADGTFNQIFTDVYKLLFLVARIKDTVVLLERNFSCLRIIKTCSNSTTQCILASHALLSKETIMFSLQ